MALYLGKDKIAGSFTDSRIGDTLPVGAIIDYDGDEVPANWELVEDGSSSENGLIIISRDMSNEEKAEKLLSGIEFIKTETGGSIKSIKPIYDTSMEGTVMPLIGLNLDATADTAGVTWIFSHYSQEFMILIEYTIADIINNPNELTIAQKPLLINNLESTNAHIPLSANQGRVLNEKIEAIPSQEITFTTRNFETGTFKALRGMSWREWLNSEYNTLSSSWEILSASIEFNAAYVLTYSNDTNVKPWDIISGGEEYSGSK